MKSTCKMPHRVRQTRRRMGMVVVTEIVVLNGEEIIYETIENQNKDLVILIISIVSFIRLHTYHLCHSGLKIILKIYFFRIFIFINL